jgi:hypothetical protein
VTFEIVRSGKTLIKLSDGNYIEITTAPLKVLKDPTKIDAEGLPQYAVGVANPHVIWTKEQAYTMLKKEEGEG